MHSSTPDRHSVDLGLDLREETRHSEGHMYVLDPEVATFRPCLSELSSAFPYGFYCKNLWGLFDPRDAEPKMLLMPSCNRTIISPGLISQRDISSLYQWRNWRPC